MFFSRHLRISSSMMSQVVTSPPGESTCRMTTRMPDGWFSLCSRRSCWITAGPAPSSGTIMPCTGIIRMLFGPSPCSSTPRS